MILRAGPKAQPIAESTIDKETAAERKASQRRHKIIFWQRRVAA